MYYGKCPEDCSPPDYVGALGRRLLERVKDHSSRDTSSHIFKHCIVADHQFVSCDDLRIVVRNYGNNKRKQKVAEAILIKNLKPYLDVQEKSVALMLFN